MYCSKCELEIKGEDKNECPICGSPLADNPFQGKSDSDEISQDQNKLQEMIEDIDGMVEKKLSEADEFKLASPSFDDSDDGADSDLAAGSSASDEEQAFVLEDIELPSGSQSEIENQEQTAGARESVQDMGFDHSTGNAEPETVLLDTPISEEHVSDETSEISEPQLSDAEPESNANQADEGTESLTAMLDSIKESMADGTPFEKQSAADDAEDALASIDNPIDGIEETINLVPSEINEPKEKMLIDDDSMESSPFDDDNDTKAVLDHALDEIETETTSRHAEKSRNKLLAYVLMVLIVAGGGYYAYITFMPVTKEQNQIRQQQVVKKQKRVTKSKKKTTPAQAPAAVAAKSSVNVKETAPDTITQQTADTGQTQTVKPTPVQQSAAAVQDEKPAEPQKNAASGETPELPVKSSIKAASGSKDKAQTANLQKKKAAARTEITKPYYTVHAGSYRRKAVAESEVKRISAKGYDAFIEAADIGARGIWYRVKIGRFKTRAEAEALKADVHKKIVPETRVVYSKD